MLVDKGEVIGEVVTTKLGAKPIYVSIGHMVSLETAVKIVKHCSKSRIPEPLLQAHNLATKKRIELGRESKVNISKSKYLCLSVNCMTEENKPTEEITFAELRKNRFTNRKNHRGNRKFPNPKN